MKESEALKKWCPKQSRIAVDKYCIGSECVMWDSFEDLKENDSGGFDVINDGEGDCGLKSKCDAYRSLPS